MTNRAVIPTRTLRDEIVGVLQAKTEGQRTAGTARWIASQISAPLRAVREELSALSLSGITKSRTHRSGEVLYSLKDHLDTAWDAFRGPGISLN